MKKLFFLFICFCAFMFLSEKNMIPSIEQMKSYLNLNRFQLSEQENPEVETSEATVNEQKPLNSTSASANANYQPTEIQTYQVTVESGKLIVTGKPTEFGKYNNANGVILYIQEVRAHKNTTIKVPFSNGKINYVYPLSYSVGDVILNLDEYYNGKENDPDKVLGYAQYTLKDSDPYLTPSYMVQSNDPSILALAQNITSGKMSDQEKSRAIFEWVAKNIAYNAPLVNATNPPIYSAVQTFQSRTVLCTGYAHLSAALHRAVGIEAKIAYGENHAWNEIMLNGVWQSEDPTYGSGYINANTNKFVRSYQPAYFSKTDKNKEGEYPW
ncbi:transglutaminase domain-containing protein [Neobacillus sp. NPDC097160]|uniref:transglutaminase domain-containing protein n=1 Tax=Neobacillus sp. NPDC097160 TaxID=3364298 RepID=UPI003828232B